MKKMLAAIALAAATAMGFSAPAEARDQIRIATEGAYPPFNFTETAGNLVGFDVDIANALCEYLDVECILVAQDWDGIIPALLANRYDAIVASMSITEERKQRVSFSNKYYQTPARFVAPKGAIAEFSDSAIQGKTVGVQSATIHANYLEDNYGDIVDIRFYETQEQANLDLITGRIDMVLADSIVLDEGIMKTDDGANFEFVGPALTDPQWFGEGVGIAVRKEDTDLVEMFNRAIAGIRANGTYDEIRAEYFEFDIYGD